MQLREIMTKELHAIPARATLQEAARIMRERDIGLLPVTEDGRLTGTLTDRDIVVRALHKGGKVEEMAVSQAMSADLVSLEEDADVERAAQIMEEKKIRRLVVVDKDARPAGIVSLGDIAVAEEETATAGGILKGVAGA